MRQQLINMKYKNSEQHVSAAPQAVADSKIACGYVLRHWLFSGKTMALHNDIV